MKLVAVFYVLVLVPLCNCRLISIPLRIANAGAPARLYPTPGTSTSSVTASSEVKRKGGQNLALDSQPLGTISFLEMVNNLKGDSGRGYYMELLIGTPPQKLNVLVDTGSSNFAVAGAPDPYVVGYFDSALSSTYQSLGLDVSVRYTQGSWSGELGKDIISISGGPNGSFTVNIATILESDNFFLPDINWQGILGLAYSALAKPSSSVEPFFDSIVREAKIENVFSMQMCGVGVALPPQEKDAVGGSLILGGIEPSLYTGPIWYTPVKEEWYYQVEILKLEVGQQNLNLDCREYNMDKAIVDSGTTLLRLPEKVFIAIVEAITRISPIAEFSSGFWTGSQLACWAKGETTLSLFPKLSIYLRGMNSSQSFRLTISSELYILYVAEVRDSLDCYRFGIAPSSNGLIIGATFMEGFYVIFDRAHARVGFAVSTCADASASHASEIAGPFSAADVASNCIATSSFSEPVFWIISYVLMSICGTALLILIVLLLLPEQCCRRNSNEVNDASSLIRHRWK